MAATAESVKQDLPPKGGYRKINFARVFPKPFASCKSKLMLKNVFENVTCIYCVFYSEIIRFNIKYLYNYSDIKILVTNLF
jgi:hypothetical protein